MARERAKLSDKQEKILMQAMLMGLDARDMQQIGNRLMALKKEADDKREIADTIQGFTWEKIKDETRKDELAGWRFTTPEGFVVEATNPRKPKRNWYSQSKDWDFSVDKPGTRFKTRTYKDKTVSTDDNWKKKFMPDTNKELYSLIRWVKNHNYEWTR